MGHCSYCDASEVQVVGVGQLAEVTHEVVSRHYLTIEGVDTWDNRIVQDLTDENVVYEAIERHLTDEHAISICDDVDAAFDYQGDWYYSNYDSSEDTSHVWQQFVDVVGTYCRLPLLPGANGFNRLEAEPEYLHWFLNTLVLAAHDDLSLVIEQQSETPMYRARPFEDSKKSLTEVMSNPAKELGPAPSQLSGSGRMNAQGVSLFYAALTQETAAAEALRHSPYDEVILGKFTATRNLSVLDLTAEPASFSPFHERASDLYRVSEFLRELKNELLKPVPLDGREAIRYAPTQLVTEFLRWASPVRLDGIIFPSRADHTGKNIILFFGPDQGAIQNDPALESEPEIEFSFNNYESPLLTLAAGSIACFRADRRVTLSEVTDPVLGQFPH